MAQFSKSTKTPWKHVMGDAKEDSRGMVFQEYKDALEACDGRCQGGFAWHGY